MIPLFFYGREIFRLPEKTTVITSINDSQGVVIATNATHSRNDIVVSGKTANDYLSSSDYGKRRIAKMISGCPFIVIASGSEAISEMPQAFRVAYRIKRQCKKPFRLPKNLSALPLS